LLEKAVIQTSWIDWLKLAKIGHSADQTQCRVLDALPPSSPVPNLFGDAAIAH
jgi:hypothetical protein